MYICQWIMNLAKWRQVKIFQYSCLNPLIPPEGICIWILTAYFFIHPIILTFLQEKFSDLFNSKMINLSVVM